MDRPAYDAFTSSLIGVLAGDSRVVGLVALGSMSGLGVPPDVFSDHDFFVVTAPGFQEVFRIDLAWLPGADRAALVHRETEHGLKVVLADGHLLEFAVFDLDELLVARANRYTVLLDRGGVAGRMAEVAAKPVEASEDRWLTGQLLGNLLVGGGHAARGELISARLFVAGWATGHLLRLLARHVPAETAVFLDDLDPFRRFERAYPRLGGELNAALARDPLEAALALLDLAERDLGPVLPVWPSVAAEAVRKRLREAREGRAAR
ncbi:MAG TPA: hypothetical protein VE129_10745 [Thermoanaerobaculia bacterium]|nr:hypothetical protein [Thermoanaerobaculia bacterium]